MVTTEDSYYIKPRSSTGTAGISRSRRTIISKKVNKLVVDNLHLIYWQKSKWSKETWAKFQMQQLARSVDLFENRSFEHLKRKSQMYDCVGVCVC